MNEFDSMNWMNLEERTLRNDEVQNLDFASLKERVNKIYQNGLSRLQYQEISLTERTALQETVLRAKEALMKNNQGALVQFYNVDYKKLLNIGTQSDYALVEDFEYVVPETQETLMPDDTDITEYVSEVSPNLAIVNEKAPATTNETFFQKHKGKLIAGGIIGALAFLGRGE